MRFVICEDDLNVQQRLSTEIEDWANSRKIHIDILFYASAEAFIIAWPNIVFDIIFLDIKMNCVSGIELAEYIRKNDRNVMIVFLTSFQQYVLKGYDVNALHYLIKPLSKAKLLPVLDKAYTIWASRHNDVLIVSTRNGKMKLPFDEILYISMSSHIANIYTENNQYELRKTAAELNNMLPKYFVYCHRSHFVNLFKTDCVYNNSLLLTNGKLLPISRKNSKIVKDSFIRLHK